MAAKRTRYGGTRLVGRRYFLGQRPVEIICGWGPDASVRNVHLRLLDTGESIVRPFRGLTVEPRRVKRAHRGKG